MVDFSIGSIMSLLCPFKYNCNIDFIYVESIDVRLLKSNEGSYKSVKELLNVIKYCNAPL